MAVYLTTSPYFETKQSGNQLGVLAKRPIPSNNNDRKYTIVKEYEYRPDLLAYDLYGDVNLWWVFINRNPDIIKDPIFDFLAGTLDNILNTDRVKELINESKNEPNKH